ncbi:MAG TPA: ferrous iron transporter B, partial [Candidatus Atribacteria bacterium]|nr:ferrous iron transporter B [Candidatus Atribacteria bacterium]
MIAIKGEGLNELIDAVMRIVKNEVSLTTLQIDYGDKIEEAISAIIKVLEELDVSSKLPYPLRWMAVRLLEGDREIIREVLAVDSSIIAKIEQLRNELSEVLGEDVDIVIADKRYELIEEIVGDVVEKPSRKIITLTDRIDRIVLNKYLGLPLLLSVFMLSFMVIFSVNIGFPLNMMFPELESFNLASLIGDYIFGYISDVVSSYLISINAPEWLVSLIVDGVISGVGSVLSFYPLVLTVFILFSVLEDSGYMARAAFIMDRIMRKFGLTGRAFMPLMLGYGCNVPSVMAARILPSGREQLLSILLNSLIPCQARLVAFMIIIAAVFHDFASQIIVMLFLYALSLFLVVLMGIIFNKLFFR